MKKKQDRIKEWIKLDIKPDSAKRIVEAFIEYESAVNKYLYEKSNKKGEYEKII